MKSTLKEQLNSGSSENSDDKTVLVAPLRPLYQLILLWTLLIIGFAAWSSYDSYHSELQIATAVARYNFNKDEVYRSWATMHGGVYVPITARTVPNPYLSHLPERDITTPSGKRLTLMNPAYMTRQAHELGLELYGLHGHITSLKPIRPENAADAWEVKALKKFEKGASEVTSKELIDGKPYIRFMKALLVEEGCLKCHATQGYKIGEVRGGISVSVPWEPYQKQFVSAMSIELVTHSVVWIIGVGGIVTGRRRLLSYFSERNRAEKEKLALELRLQQGQKLESLGVLAGGIAHDFNNILATIIGHCGILQLRPEKVAKCVPEIESAAERAAALCRQMLAYAGKSQTVMSRFDMTILVAEMVAMLKATTPQNVVINTNLATDVLLVKGDSEQFRQIIINLLTNAAEAIGAAEGEIRVSLTKTEIMAGDLVKDHLGRIIPAGSYACLEVTDTGCGMDAETSSRIFEPFYTTRFFGRGLGLPATLGIITAHKGAVQLHSQPGQGTTVKVFLPV